MSMTIARRPLNKSALACVWAESEIKRIVKDAFFLRLYEAETRKKADKVIKKAMKDITIPTLREAAFISLWTFYRQQQALWRTIPYNTLLVFLALGKKSGTVEYAKKMTQTQATEIISRSELPVFEEATRDTSKQYGVPLGEYTRKYFEERIKPTMEHVARARASDPFASKKNISLRAKAELEVRYEHNQNMIADLMDSGVRLVVSSSHADCSVRCRPWQNRVYSLDGTSGKTDDGRFFVPLEIATEIGTSEHPVKYKTKAGITYNNGLLGFNCRHYLVPYKKGLQFGKYSEAVEAKEYKITVTQRKMEREIYNLRDEAMLSYGLDAEKYRKLATEAAIATKKYINYSKRNGRAIYLARTEL